MAAQDTYSDTWRQVTRLGTGYNMDIDWSPDGRLLAVAGCAGVWLYTPELAFIRLLEDVEGCLDSVSWSPDGKRLAAQTSDWRRLYLWDTTTWQQIDAIETKGSGIAWSPDGSQIAVGESAIIEVDTGRQQTPLDIHDPTWSPDGSRLAGTPDGNSVVLVDPDTGLHQMVMDETIGFIDDLVWSPDGTQLAAFSYNYGGTQLIEVWDTGSGAKNTSFEYPGGSIHDHLDWSADGTRLAVGTGERVFLYDAHTWERQATLENPQNQGVGPIAWSPDGTRLATAGLSVAIWDVQTRQILASLPAEQGEFTAADWSPDGSHLVVGGSQTLLYDADSWQLAGTTYPPGMMLKLTYSPDGRYLAGWHWGLEQTGTNRVGVLNVTSGQEVMTFETTMSTTGDGVIVWSPDSRYLAIGVVPSQSISDAPTIEIWDVTTGEQVAALSGQASVWALAWSPDGSRLASGSAYNNKTIRVWNTLSWQAELIIPVAEAGVTTLAWSPDGLRLVAGVRGNPIFHVWDSNSGQRLALIEDPGQGGVYSVAWSPDGTRIATGSSVITIWDAASGQSLAILEGHKWWVEGLSWTPDSRRLASSSVDGTVRVWELSETTLPAAEIGRMVCLTTTSSNANLRAAPGTTFDRVGKVNSGMALQVVGQNDAGDWYQIMRSDWSLAWIASFLVKPPVCPAKTTLPIIRN